MPIILGISGKAGSGKDCSANLMKEQLEADGKKVLLTHYADLLKFVLRDYFNWDGQKDEKGRSLLQYIGTDVFRTNCPNAWDKIMEYMIKGFGDMFDYVLIADCRFFDDVNWFERAGFAGYTIRVHRPYYTSKLTEAQQQHRSEVELDNYKFDYMLLNDGSIEDLANNIRIILKDIESKN